MLNRSPHVNDEGNAAIKGVHGMPLPVVLESSLGTAAAAAAA